MRGQKPDLLKAVTVGLGLALTVITAWWVYDLCRRYTYFTAQNYIRQAIWTSTPYLGFAVLMWGARRRPLLRRVFAAAMVVVAISGLYYMNGYLQGDRDQQDDLAWILLYAPLAQWALASPFLLVAGVIWTIKLRAYRREKWQEYTTRGGDWVAKDDE